jgi:uncharacterized protein with HEPN domain
MQRDIASIRDIVTAAYEIQAFIGDSTEEAFLQDDLRFSAVIHKLLIVGEACTRLSDNFRGRYPEIPWKKIIGMRNILIHAYDDIILQEVWFAATVSLPELMPKLELMLSSDS